MLGLAEISPQKWAKIVWHFILQPKNKEQILSLFAPTRTANIVATQLKYATGQEKGKKVNFLQVLEKEEALEVLQLVLGKDRHTKHLLQMLPRQKKRINRPSLS